MSNILEIPMDQNDIDARTVGEYLRCLLTTVWEEGEGFSGKRPFGNSDWKWDVYAALVKAGVVGGALDEDGYLDDDLDTDAADRVIYAAIHTMGAQS